MVKMQYPVIDILGYVEYGTYVVKCPYEVMMREKHLFSIWI